MDTQTASKACRLGFLILELVIERSPIVARNSWDFFLYSVLGLSFLIRNPISRYSILSFLTQEAKYKGASSHKTWGCGALRLEYLCLLVLELKNTDKKRLMMRQYD